MSHYSIKCIDRDNILFLVLTVDYRQIIKNKTQNQIYEMGLWVYFSLDHIGLVSFK